MIIEYLILILSEYPELYRKAVSDVKKNSLKRRISHEMANRFVLQVIGR